MRILVAIDSLKGSLSSLEAGLAIKEALEDFCDVVVKPVADGGEGSVEAMADALDAKFIDTIVKNPLGTEILARYALKDDLAILEMSSASGLTLINPDERNPMKTSTFGFGQMIKDAISKGARKFIIGIGGSATNDAGTGMLSALGFKFYDKNGKKNDKFLLVRPLTNARITSAFTLKRWHPILQRYRAHLGVDYGAPKGTPIKAAGDGTVKFVGQKSGYGRTVIISHAGGYETLYAHLNGFAKGIRSGLRVKQGTLIAYVGTSGMSTGPHLHFGLYLGGKPINPESAIKVVKNIEDKKESAKFKAVVNRDDELIRQALSNDKEYHKVEFFPNVIDF